MIWHLYLIATSDGRIVWPDKHKENNLNILHNKKTKNKKKTQANQTLSIAYYSWIPGNETRGYFDDGESIMYAD